MSRAAIVARVALLGCATAQVADASFEDAERERRAGEKVALAQVLNPDGSIDTSHGFSGTLDPTGYKMVTAPDGAPRFVQQGMQETSAASMTCDPNASWDERFSPIGFDDEVLAFAVSGTDIYAGGRFTSAGGVRVNYIAKWDGSAWSALGTGMNGPVFALAVSGTDVYAGGFFTSAGGVSANYIAKWDGSTWSPVGTGMSLPVFALAASGTDVYAGGAFTSAGGLSASKIAKWDGNTWSPLGTGMSHSVHALVVSGTDVYAGGSFTSAGGVSASKIAKWNGSTWSALGGGTNSDVVALAASGTDVYAGGYFTNAGGVAASGIARWDGSSWSDVGGGVIYFGIPESVPGQVLALSVSGTDVYAGGGFTVAGTSPSGAVVSPFVAKWNGSEWSAMGSGTGAIVRAVAVSGTDVYAGGDFKSASGLSADHIAKWDGGSWSSVGQGTAGHGLNGEVRALALSGTHVYAGGFFTRAGDVSANHVAKWDGNTWSVLGSGVNQAVGALAVSGTDVYVGGGFTSAGGVSANRIAKWNGSTWSPLGSGMNNEVRALAVSGTDVYAGGGFTSAGGVGANRIAKWNGSTWSALGTGMDLDVNALAVSGTDVYAGGSFNSAGGVSASRIAKWNGSVWSALGSGVDGYVAALLASGSDVYAGGFFTSAGGVSANRIAKWDGSTWSTLGTGMSNRVEALAVRGTDLYAGGAFESAGGVNVNGVAKWDGTNWSALGGGVNSDAGQIFGSLLVSGTNLYVGGPFTVAGGKLSSYFARWQTIGNCALDSGEQCDDGNTADGDGCSSTSQIEIGWSCPVPGMPCTLICGDGLIITATECEDGNSIDGDCCSADCELETANLGCITSGSVTKNAGNDADQAPSSFGTERSSTVEILSSTGTSLQTRYAGTVSNDSAFFGTINIAMHSDYTVHFSVLAPPGSPYSVEVDTLLFGALNILNDFSGSANSSFGPVSGLQSGGTLVGDLSLPGTSNLSNASNPNVSVNAPLNRTGTATINGIGSGSPVAHSVTFTWDQQCQGVGVFLSYGDDCAVRLGLSSTIPDFTAGLYPGLPPRTASADGHFFSATLNVPCGNGVVDVGEACDLGDDNGALDSCCTVSCALRPAMDVCRPMADLCDAPETCAASVDGSCPGDALLPSGAVCRPASAVCDVGEQCDGVSTACPADNFLSSSSVCRASGGMCDPAENCTGSSAGCPADMKSTAICRPAAGECDLAESCDGGSNHCPADAMKGSTVTCRPAAGVCDAVENCTGSSSACPPDVKSTAVCRPPAGGCDQAESCSGSSNDCPADAFTTSGVCRPTAGDCDLPESCDGSGAQCPTDGFKPAATACTSDGDPCTADECSGASASCVHGDADEDTVGDLCDNCVSDENPDQENSDCNDPDYFLTVGCAAPPNNKAGCCDGGDVCDACPALKDNASCDPQGSAAGTVGPAGDSDSIITPDGAVSVVIPPGALPSDTSISVTENGPPTRFILGNAAVFSVSMRPEDRRFALPVTITFTWQDRDNDDLVDRGTCVGEGDAGESCDHDDDCASEKCSLNTNTAENALVLKRNTAEFSKGGFGSSPYKCSDHLSGACSTAVPNCSHLPGMGQATVANCCNPSSNTWTFKTCSFSEFFLGLTAGDLVPGKGSASTDCMSEWGIRNPLNIPFADKGGLPNFKQTCMDGDPSCDADGLANGVCEIEVSVCLNVEDPRLVDGSGTPACTPAAVDRWVLKKPRPDSNKPSEAANATALRNAVAALAASSIAGSHQEQVTFTTPLAAGDECTEPVHIQVPLKSPTKKGKVILKMESATGTVRDSDKLKITCLPSDAAP